MHTFSHISQIVVDRWNEAVASPDVARYRSLAQMAAALADTIEKDEPDSILAPAMRGIYEAAYQRMIDMTKHEDSK